MKIKLQDIAKVVESVKKEISDEYRAFDGDEEPGIQLTVACDSRGVEWSYQTGDNSFMGSAYHFPHWAVVGVYRDSDSNKLAKQILDELGELVEED